MTTAIIVYFYTIIVWRRVGGAWCHVRDSANKGLQE
jgi:hypothetical protein